MRIENWGWKALFVALMVGAVGCAHNIKQATAGQIGCPSEEIEIVERSPGWNTGTWVAECRGRLYHCSSVSAGESVQVACKEDNATSGSEVTIVAPPAAQGCVYDTQCKADRVCEAGRCVEPPPKSEALPAKPIDERSGTANPENVPEAPVPH